MNKNFVIVILILGFNLFSNDNFSPPQLEMEIVIPYSRSLLVHGVDDSCLIQLVIDRDGLVKEVEILNSINSISDSIIISSFEEKRFIPAKEDGEFVESIVEFKIDFDLEEAIKEYHKFKTFSGVIIDSINKAPIENAEITFKLKKSLLQHDLKYSNDKYLNVVSKFSGQFRKEDHIASLTNVNGQFYLYGLIDGIYDLHIHHHDYKTSIIKNITLKEYLNLDTINLKRVNYDLIEESDLEMVVTQERDKYREKLNIEMEFDQGGITDDVNNLISRKAPVVSVNQSGSELLINGGGVYDNHYILNGISIFTPTHFPGFSSIDKNGVVMSDLSELKLITERIGGRYPNASGSIIEMNTSKSRDESVSESRVKFDLSYEKLVATLSQSLRGGKDLYQFSYSMAHKGYYKSYYNVGYYLEVKSDYGYSTPLMFYDYQFKTSHKLKKGRVSTFFWYGIDKYYDSDYYRGKDEPIRFGSITYSSSDKPNSFNISIGASSQYYDEGKRIGRYSPIKQIKRNNSSISIEKKGLEIGPFKFDEKIQFDLMDWNGTLGNRNYSYYYRELMSTENREMILTNKFSAQYEKDRVVVGLDFLAGSKFEDKSSFVDPGIWFLLPFYLGNMTFSTGVVSSYPDVRGMPDEKYLNEVYKTYMGATKLTLPINEKFSASFEQYLKYTIDCPVINFNPKYPIWDDTLKSPVYSRGLNVEIDVSLPRFLTLSIAGSVNKSNRYLNKKSALYEWEIPWQIKGTAHFFFFEERVNFFLKPIFSAGAPYYDYANEGKVTRGENTFTLDCILEFHSERFVDTPIQLMEAYLGIKNISFTRNGSEVFWDSNMVPLSYNLTPLQLTFGARAAVGKRWRSKFKK